MALPHAEPGQAIDLAPLGDDLEHAATHAILKTSGLELIRIVLPQGKALQPHRVAGDVTIHCLEGDLAVAFDGSTCRLLPGQLVLLPGGTEHAVHAAADSSALLTLQIARAQTAAGKGHAVEPPTSTTADDR